MGFKSSLLRKHKQIVKYSSEKMHMGQCHRVITAEALDVKEELSNC